MPRTEDEARLLELLRERAHVRGTFTLASGKTSDFFIDCKRVLLLAEGHRLAGRAIFARLAGAPIVAVAGVELGGCPLASSVAFASASLGDSAAPGDSATPGDSAARADRATGRSPLDALYVRKSAKDHGTKKLIEGGSHLPQGSKVALLEDVVTSGGSSLRAIAELRAAGYEVERVVAIVDRDEGAAAAFLDAKVPFSSLFSRNDFDLG